MEVDNTEHEVIPDQDRRPFIIQQLTNMKIKFSKSSNTAVLEKRLERVMSSKKQAKEVELKIPMHFYMFLTFLS